MADKVKDSIDVKATTEEIFAVATDFAAYPEWNSDIKETLVKETDDQGRATHVWFKVDAKLKVVSYTLEYDYSDAPDSFSWSLLDGDIKKLEGSYAFDEFDDITEVNYEMEIDPGFPVPGFLKKQAEKRIARGALEDLKKRVESR
jgi:ribosome-associated toxin RatA of RatAB toxin-antitoxin module